MKSNALFLEPGIAYELHTIQSDLAGRGSLSSPERLREREAAFRERFGPTTLAGLDGEELLHRLHGRDMGDDSLICRLEQPGDDTVGSLGGGSAFRGDLFFSRVRGGWIGGTPTDSRLLSTREAAEVVRRHRDELVCAAQAMEVLPVGADEAAYRALQAEIDRVAPTIGDAAWGHKYLSQLFPNVLDPFHAPDTQRHHLLRLLLTPPDDRLRRTRYAMAGLFAGVAHALDVPLAHLGALLTARHGRRPRGYWRVAAGAGWEAMLRDGYATLPEGVAGQVRTGDVAVAMDVGGAVQGLGIVRPNDGYQAGDRFPVEWQSIEPWTLPVPERTSRGSRSLARQGENVREIERHLLADTAPFQPTPPAARSRRNGMAAASNPAAARVAEERQGYSAQATQPEKSTPVPLPPLTGMTARIASVLARKGQVILHGPPGTGKTYGAEAAARELAARSWFGVAANRLTPAQAAALTGEGGDSGLGLPAGGAVRLVCFHPAYGYEDFLEGYRPVAAESSAGVGSELRFERRDGIFKRLCRDAAAHPRGDFFLIIDEINRGDTPRIFGELLTVLEPGKRGRHVLLPLSGESFAVSPNVYLIGTMNTTDRSIALLDAALRRRFGFIETPPDLTLLAGVSISDLPLASWLGALNRRIRERLGADGRQTQIGHAYFLRPDGTPIDDLPALARILREDIVPLIEEHTYEDPDLLEALLGADLIDARTGSVRDELFAPGREEGLRRALLDFLPADERSETGETAE